MKQLKQCSAKRKVLGFSGVETSTWNSYGSRTIARPHSRKQVDFVAQATPVCAGSKGKESQTLFSGSASSPSDSFTLSCFAFSSEQGMQYTQISIGRSAHASRGRRMSNGIVTVKPEGLQRTLYNLYSKCLYIRRRPALFIAEEKKKNSQEKKCHKTKKASPKEKHLCQSHALKSGTYVGVLRRTRRRKRLKKKRKKETKQKKRCKQKKTKRKKMPVPVFPESVPCKNRASFGGFRWPERAPQVLDESQTSLKVYLRIFSGCSTKNNEK